MRPYWLLHPEDVHIWRIPLNRDDPEAWIKSLSDRERQKANQFAFAEDRARYLVAHGYCRLILSRYLRVKASQIEFGETEKGKPIVLNPIDPPVHFNLTHSKELALVAISTHPVGIDTEYLNPTLDFDEMAPHIMSPQEWEIFQQLPQPQKMNAFYCCWTRKEAYVKALGKGLSYPIQQVTVSLDHRQIDSWSDQYHPLEKKRWRMFHIDPSPEYIGAVVCQGEHILHFSVDFIKR